MYSNGNLVRFFYPNRMIWMISTENVISRKIHSNWIASLIFLPFNGIRKAHKSLQYKKLFSSIFYKNGIIKIMFLLKIIDFSSKSTTFTLKYQDFMQKINFLNKLCPKFDEKNQIRGFWRYGRFSNLEQKSPRFALFFFFLHVWKVLDHVN